MQNISKINVVMWVTDDGKTFETPEEAEGWAKYLEYEDRYKNRDILPLYAEDRGRVDFSDIHAWILDNKDVVQDVLNHIESLGCRRKTRAD